jgi:microcystin-dependent protein
MSQPYVGEIRMFAGNFAPAGWMLCQGQLLPISEYETLFNLIGTTYGGDGQATFQLPDLQSRIPVHMGTGSDGISYQLAQNGGVESVTLTLNQTPAHSHVMVADGSGANGSSTPGNNYLGKTTFPAPPSPAPATYTAFAAGANQRTLAASSLQSSGGSQPHDNMVPFLCVNFIISLFGVFPSPT